MRLGRTPRPSPELDGFRSPIHGIASTLTPPSANSLLLWSSIAFVTMVTATAVLELDEVVTAQARMEPSSQIRHIQHYEGGSIRDVLVASCEIRYGEPARRLTHDKVRRLRGATLRVPTLCACTAAAAHRPIQSVLDLEANLGFQFPFQCHCSCRYKYIAACRPPNRPPVGAVRGTAG